MASNYNSRLKPAEVLIIKGENYLIRERETIEDLFNNQKVVDIKNIYNQLDKKKSETETLNKKALFRVFFVSIIPIQWLPVV